MKRRIGFSVVGLGAAWAIARGGWVKSLLSSNYLPHRYCYRASPGLVWTNVTSDALIAVSYVVIFGCLLWIASKLRRLPQLRGFIWIFVAFGAFIVSCAITHLMEVVTVWIPFYPLSASLKVVCAAVSLPTAILFIRAAPAIDTNISRFFALLATAEQLNQDAAANYRGQIEAFDRSQMMIEFNMDGTVIAANENYLRVFGHTNADIAGGHHSIFVTQEFKQSKEYAEFWDGLRHGIFQSGLFLRIDKQGKEVWIEASYNPVPGGYGNPAKVVEFATDVTARIETQRQLQDAQARLQAILNSVLDGIITIDGTGTIVSFNPAATRMFGYEEAEVTGQNIRMLMPEPDRNAHDGHLARYLSTDKSIAIALGSELEGLTRTGKTFPIELTISDVSFQGRKFFVGLVRDVTERRQAEEALRDLASLLYLSHDSIIVRELDGAIRFWNRGAEEMYGYNKPEAIGHISHELLRTVFPKGPKVIEAFLVQHGHWEGELRHTVRDGSPILVESRWVVQPSLNGAPPRVMETNIDITERRRAEEELVRYTRALERSNLELDAFAYAASHDLKAPLRVIHNASKWIEEDLAGKLTAELSENMNLLRSRVRRMDRLLDDLLEYSRIGRETDGSHTEAITGTVLMENIQGLISPPPGFAVDTSSTLAGIEVFRMPLQQILINLISNAIKHHDKKTGRIEVSVEDIGAVLRFSVKDDGPGIPAEYHEQIFKMFQTLKPRDQVEGSGMGLAMVRKHVDLAGGELKLESVVGRGSTFSFTWPKDNGSTNKTKHKFKRIGET